LALIVFRLQASFEAMVFETLVFTGAATKPVAHATAIKDVMMSFFIGNKSIRGIALVKFAGHGRLPKGVIKSG